MSVKKKDRRLAKTEAEVYAKKLDEKLTDLMARNFGIKDLEHMARTKFARGELNKEAYCGYHENLLDIKKRLRDTMYIISQSIVAASTIYPTTMHELEKRRDYQNMAIANCEILLSTLQKTITIFDVNMNLYEDTTKAISREIDLIKRWRQRDNRFKSTISGQRL